MTARYSFTTLRDGTIIVDEIFDIFDGMPAKSCIATISPTHTHPRKEKWQKKQPHFYEKPPNKFSVLAEYNSLVINDGSYRYYTTPCKKKITHFKTQEEAKAYLVAKLVAEKMLNS